MICFYYNVCDCHAFTKGNLLTYLLTYFSILSPNAPYKDEIAEVVVMHKDKVKMIQYPHPNPNFFLLGLHYSVDLRIHT